MPTYRVQLEVEIEASSTRQAKARMGPFMQAAAKAAEKQNWPCSVRVIAEPVDTAAEPPSGG